MFQEEDVEKVKHTKDRKGQQEKVFRERHVHSGRRSEEKVSVTRWPCARPPDVSVEAFLLPAMQLVLISAVLPQPVDDSEQCLKLLLHKNSDLCVDI